VSYLSGFKFWRHFSWDTVYLRLRCCDWSAWWGQQCLSVLWLVSLVRPMWIRTSVQFWSGSTSSLCRRRRSQWGHRLVLITRSSTSNRHGQSYHHRVYLQHQNWTQNAEIKQCKIELRKAAREATGHCITRRVSVCVSVRAYVKNYSPNFTKFSLHVDSVRGTVLLCRADIAVIWTLLEQETVSGSGISWAVCKSAPRSRQITTPAPHHSVCYRPDALPAAQPTASEHWRHLFSYFNTAKKTNLLVTGGELCLMSL